MKISISLQHYILAGLVLLTMSLLINVLPIIQFIVGIFLIDLLSTAYGQIVMPGASIIYKWIIGFIALICLLIIGGSIIIYTLSINALSMAALWFLLFLIPIIIWRKQEIILAIEYSKPNINLKSLILPIIFIILAAALSFIFIQGSTTGVIYSVWALLSSYWIYIYYLLAIVLLIIIYSSNNELVSLWSGIFIFLSIGLGAILYKLGYGFDYHIHTATTKYIWDTGTISPKPLYYIGYYSLILNFKWLLGLSLAWLNKFIVIIVFAGVIPTIIYNSLKTAFDSKKEILKYLPLTILLIPYTLLTLSTPQSLANTLFILLITLTLPYLFEKELSIKYLWLITVAICFIHPITGVPAILLILFISLRNWRRSNYVIGKQRQILFILGTILATFVLPILFFINSYLSGNSIDWQLPNISFHLPVFHNYVSFFDYLYNFTWLLPLLVIILVIGGIIYIYRMNRIFQFSEYLLTLLILIINYIWLRFFINFNWLIDYERLNYANRLIDLIFICSLPFLFIAISILLEKILDNKLYIKIFTLLLIAIILTSTFYLSYPTRDPYSFNKSLNTSANDITIVQTINEFNGKYVVLANQAVSAAALSAYGFVNYYNSIFYYPLPTSGQLYQLYLDAAYQRKPISRILNDVNDLVNINNVFIVINEYWSNSANLIAVYKKTATNWQQLNNDYIFYYNLADNISQ